MGPNIKHVPGAYWDFFDHHLPLTAQFLPYTMSHGRQYPAWMLRMYLSMPVFWRLAGAQFLVVMARKLLVPAR